MWMMIRHCPFLPSILLGSSAKRKTKQKGRVSKHCVVDQETLGHLTNTRAPPHTRKGSILWAALVWLSVSVSLSPGRSSFVSAVMVDPGYSPLLWRQVIGMCVPVVVFWFRSTLQQIPITQSCIHCWTNVCDPNNGTKRWGSRFLSPSLLLRLPTPTIEFVGLSYAS